MYLCCARQPYINSRKLLSGQEPYQDLRSPIAVMNAIENDRRPPKQPPCSLAGRSYAAVWDVVDRCWAHNPSKRPQMKDVQVLLHVGHLVTRPTRGATPLAQPTSRYRPPVIRPHNPNTERFVIVSLITAAFLTLVRIFSYATLSQYSR